MLEVEMKFADADFEALERQLDAWGAGPPIPVEQSDHYFNAPNRDFGRTDEALRVRQEEHGAVVTYKGPKLDTATKTRREIEISLGDRTDAAAEFRTMLQLLGYRPTFVVHKRRRKYHLAREGFAVEVSLDAVDGLGPFAELEIQAEESNLDNARSVLQDVAAALGLTRAERRSYLEMLLRQADANARNGNHANGNGKRPRLVRTVEQLRQAVREARKAGRTIGLVPTMGALHEGHASLVAQARRETGFVVVTLFVNPTQFGPNEDLDRYPRTPEADLELCGREGADLVFVPDAATIYPPGFRTYVEVTGLQDVLEGESRPGHFRGVATVVLKLFNLVQADVAYFGQKDAQQVRILQQMVSDLNVPVEIRVCATVRESDGLALSSRNRYLDSTRRQQAVALWQALREAERLAAAGERDAAVLRRAMIEQIGTAPDAVIDYVAVVDPDSLQPLTRLDGPALAALAVKFGSTRLIDNAVIGGP